MECDGNHVTPPLACQAKELHAPQSVPSSSCVKRTRPTEEEVARYTRKGYQSMRSGFPSLIWMTVATIACLALCCLGKPSLEDWRVTSIIRTIDLGGSVTVLSDAHVIRAQANTDEATTDDQVPPYYFAYSQSDVSKFSVLEVTAKFGAALKPEHRKILIAKDEGPLDTDSNEILARYVRGGNHTTSIRPHLYSVRLPADFMQRLHKDEQVPDITLTINALLLHTSEPLPPTVGQSESQFLLWKGDAAPIAVYDVEKARVKVKSSHPRILSYSTEPPLPAEKMTKSGTVVTFGPYERIPSVLKSSDSNTGVAKAQVHYLHDAPVVSIVEAKRVVTVSHWKKTMSIEDDFWLRNDGAALKGHFSRIEHQMSAYIKKDNSHVLSNMVMQLPPGARDAYFVDQAGNVSTSKFRPAPPSPQHISTSPHLLSGSRASVLDLKPRYPVLGGWNYSFSVGWNVKLSDGWQTSNMAGSYTLQVPFMTPITDVAVDKANLQIILPEGASNVKVKLPFSVEKQSYSTRWHFLDTIGSPVIELEKYKCSERHGGLVTIQYSLSTLDHYRKVFVGVVLVAITYISIQTLSKLDLRIK